MHFDPRWTDDPRDRDDEGRELSPGSRGGLSNPRERERLDVRDVFTRDLDMPRGPERERVWARDSDVRLRGSKVRALAMESGAGTIEPLVLPHAYSHLAPLVGGVTCPILTALDRRASALASPGWRMTESPYGQRVTRSPTGWALVHTGQMGHNGLWPP